MKKLSRLSLALSFSVTFVVAMLLTSAAQAADDLSGTWAAEVEISGNQGTPTFTLKQDGEKLSGKYKGQFGESDLKGTVKDKDVEFSFEIEGGGKVVYKGTIDKDTMKGSCDYAGQAQGTWTAKKKEKE